MSRPVYQPLALEAAKACHNFAKHFGRQGNEPLARRYITRALAYSNDTDLLYDCARVYLNGQLFAEAIEIYTRLTSLLPRQTYPILMRAFAYVRWKKWQEAIDDCTAALVLNDRSIDAYNLRADARYELGQYLECIADCGFLLSLASPPKAKTYIMLSIAYYKMGNLEEAITQIRLAIQTDPHEWHGHYNLGRYLIDRQQYEESLAAYMRATEIDDSQALAFWGCAVALAYLERTEDFLAYLEETLKLNPAYRESARQPRLFAQFRQHPRFRALVGEEKSTQDKQEDFLPKGSFWRNVWDFFWGNRQ